MVIIILFNYYLILMTFDEMVNLYAKDDFYKLHYIAQNYLEERKKQLK